MKSKYELLVEALDKRGYLNQDLVDEIVQIYGREQLSIHGVVKSLPTKDEIISEGAKQINDWLEGNTEREKQHYLIGFRRSYEYVLRRLK